MTPPTSIVREILGKTTTTERMLYYSGHTRRIGNVDDGSTITDFLPAERARGVTIQAAAITFHWPPIDLGSDGTAQGTPNAGSLLSTSQAPHTINLIDTPGHADFTFEVVRSLRILDGAVCILDAVAGVEAQTEKVLQQAARYRIPKIVYVNKLDRDGAAFGKTVQQIASRLHTWPAVCQIPIYRSKGEGFCGVGDAINMQAYRWEEGGNGKQVQISDLNSLRDEDPDLFTELNKARAALVELLGSHDEQMVEKYLDNGEDYLKISSADVVASLRRCVLDPSTNMIPVFAGASLRNIGVQPLLDAVVNLLPSPRETPDPEIALGSAHGTLSKLLEGKMLLDQPQPVSDGTPAAAQESSTASIQNLEACALAFKVVNDPHRGALVYVRVYSGSIRSGSLLFNTNLQLAERAPTILKMLASDSVEIEDLPAGQIGVILGLKHTRTGDTLISYTGATSQTSPPAPLDTLQLRPIEVPPAVFFSSIELRSLKDEKSVMDALAMLIREDPSLQLSVDDDSGQTLLSGMGEFHLEIARDRLVNDLKAKADMSGVKIAYRESVLAASGPETFTFDRDIAGRRGKAGCTATVSPLSDSPSSTDETPTADTYTNISMQDGNRIIATVEGSGSHLSLPVLHSALESGARAALSRGINHGFPLTNTLVSLTVDPCSQLSRNDTSPAALSSAARFATQAALVSAAQQSKDRVGGNGSALMELVMNVSISCDGPSFGLVMNDISSARGGHIISIDDAASPSSSSSSNNNQPNIDLSNVYTPPDPFSATAAHPTTTKTAKTDGSQEPVPDPTLVDSGSGGEGGGAPETGGTTTRTIVAKVPLEQMVGYLKHLRSLTGGRGTFVMSPDRFERVVGPREKELLRKLSGGGGC
ncbi:MAG: hypothetical protein Q9191_007566 [Dirinaria sp. TL-2023a]